MRFHLLTAVLIASVAMPVAAQNSVPVNKRINKLEQEMRAVQRKVFPGGNVEPEIRPVQITATPMGAPAASPVADLTARGLGTRSQRFVLVAKDGVATHVAVEEPGAFEVSKAESVLAAL